MSQTTFELTGEQDLAVRSAEQRLVVTAAAGSGKTRVLVARYLKHIVEDGLQPDQILTITFTRKAAAEMKRRIVDQLTGAGLFEQAQIAETGPIQTIHGFCERLLRENSLTAGLDPQFDILSEGQAARLREESVRQTLAYPPDDFPEALNLIESLAGKRFFGETDSPHARLEAAVRETISAIRGTGITPDWLESQHQSPFAVQARWRALLLESGVPPEVKAAFDAEETGDLATRLTAAFKAVRRAKPNWITPTVNEDILSAEQTCGLVQLACHAWRLFEREMIRRQELDFTLLEAKAVELMTQSEQARQRVQRQYLVALVDEAQDLNPVQYELLQAMNLKTEMLVGDAQQSIYGFRQADVSLFQKRTLSSPSLRLSKNWRSEPGVLTFVDEIFSAKWSERYEVMGDRKIIDFNEPSRPIFDGVEVWPMDDKDTYATALLIKQFLDEHRTEGLMAKDVAVLVRKSRYAMDLLKKLERVGVPARVAGGTEQFYTRLEVRDLSNALRALSDPYDDYALLAVLRSPFVGISLDSFVLLGAPEENKPPIIDTLISFEPPIEGDRELILEFLKWFEPLRKYADRLSAWEAMSELFARTKYLEQIAKRRNGQQLLANVRKLLALAAQEPELGPLEYSERVREIQALRHKEGDAPAVDDDEDMVTIMTIHKAKGLEYPAVIVPDTFDEPSHRPKDVEFDPWLPMLTTKFGPRASMFHFWLDSRRKDRETEEEWRVLYVALTRAQKNLAVVVSPKSRRGRFSNELCKLLGYKDQPPGGLAVRELRQDSEALF